MNNEFEYDTLPADTEDAATYENDVQHEVFVPREPQPSRWAMDEIKLIFTRGEELFVYIMASLLVVTLLISTIFFAATADGWTQPAPNVDPGKVTTQPEDTAKTPELNKGPFSDGKKGNVLYSDASSVKTLDLSGFSASHGALAKLSDGQIIASSGADQRVYPASLTKVMTLVVVAEHLRSEAALQETITISDDIVVTMKAEGASGMGLAAGEKLTVESLLYMLMLQSDGVAACELARYVADTEEAFVALMNKKAQSMGLTGTHFTNPTGLYNENHYSTCRDLATLMGYAMNMSLCRKIMTEDSFDAPCTQATGSVFSYHVYNNLLVTHFNKYEDMNPATAGKLTVIAGKTGYTPESKYCLVTCAMGSDGSYYICVTVGADSYADSIKAYQAIYGGYVG
ncbi:MAG: D-alanyl-D-alanine carboxypeptidase [Clostridia bacterium]|nr:D-alanyl-D-alanine carboxypeptidase [Clostridia bacterium]